MALATLHLQGSCSTLNYVPSSWTRGSKVKHFLHASGPVRRNVRLISLKCRSCSSLGPSLVLRPKYKFLKVSAFKGNSQHDDSGGRTNGSKSLKNPIKVSYVQHGNEESSVESSEGQNVVSAPYKAEETTTRSQAIQNLFRNWLMLLHTPSRAQPVEETVEEPSSAATTQMPNTIQKQEKGEILKAVWCFFLGSDAAITMPLLMFTPMYFAVNLIYGSEVSKELTPLWILGPLIVALYIKMIKGICSLYVFSFKQTVNIVKNLPACYMLVHEYLFRGKLKEVIRARLWQPLADIKNMDYKELARIKLKNFQEWLVEKYLDYVESIWPYYCRTIRFLKRANLI